MKKLVVVKIGGHVVDDEQALSSFLKQFAALDAAKLLIHGGGKMASQMSERLGISPQLVDGRRITNQETLKVVAMVYGGLVNKQVVAQLQGFDCNAIGLTGADGNLLPASKRPVDKIDYGFVGDVKVDWVNKELMSQFIGLGLAPVIAALTHDGAGQLLNTNADTMAAVMAQALSKDFEVQLVYCFEQIGVMKNLDKGLVFNTINKENTERYINKGRIHSGMLPKLENAFRAKAYGLKDVRIGHYTALQALANQTEGTEVL